MDIYEARKLVCDSGKKLLKDGLVAGTWGNVSCRIDSERMVITPSGISYDELTPEDMVLMDLNDLSYEGKLKPSSEKGMHAAIYKAKKEVNGIIHTHSLYASIVAAKGVEVTPYVEDTAMILGSSVKVVKHAFTGSAELNNGVVAALDNRFAAILQNHGAVCVGRDMKEAFAACHILEKSCQIFINICLLGGGEDIPVDLAEKFRDGYLNYYQNK
jgi:L-fuculose-phosphate aldolase